MTKHQERKLLNIGKDLASILVAAECTKKGGERNSHLLSTYYVLSAFSMIFLRNRNNFLFFLHEEVENTVA